MENKKRLLVFIAMIFLLLLRQGRGNNIQIQNVTIASWEMNEDYVLVQFDLSWENSFRDEVNWDAAWVFVKYQLQGSSEWQHAWLGTTAAEHTVPAGYTCTVGSTTIDTINRGMGVFIYRSANGSGNTSLADVQIRWVYGANGVTDSAPLTLKVFAIEMVYVPQGPFYLGDADADLYYNFYTYGTSGPYLVTGEGEIPLGQTTGYLWAPNYVEAGALPAAFPKGYDAFYCMKYEISQGQWVDFFNTLADSQKATRDMTSYVAPLWGKYSDNVEWRNTISIISGFATCTTPDRTCNYLCWSDGTAYADWAGLRPMTELEYEKACRGTLPVVDDEFAWGSADIIGAAAISGDEDGTEIISTAGANCRYNYIPLAGGDGGDGPLRGGIFARSATTREAAGSSYYGIMELSGNVWELAVNISNAAGKGYTGLHGDGSLDDTGMSDVANWPVYNSTAISYRGGAWDGDASAQRVSNRYLAGLPSFDRDGRNGFRCVRTAPSS